MRLKKATGEAAEQTGKADREDEYTDGRSGKGNEGENSGAVPKTRMRQDDPHLPISDDQSNFHFSAESC